MAKIIDCFPYFNEIEILEFRIKYLRDSVDEFIISDGNKTQNGKTKEFSCMKALCKLGLENENIRILEVEMPSLEEDKNSWNRERMQRNSAAEYIDDDTIAIISDCDEIVNKDHLQYIASIVEQHQDSIVRLPMVYLNNRADLRVYDEYGNTRSWNAPFVCLKKHLEKYTLSEIRETQALFSDSLVYKDIFITENNQVKELGWHFSWMGGSDRLKYKCSSSMHTDDIVEGVVAQFGSEKMLKYIGEFKPIENSSDVLGRKNHILKKYDVNDLPKLIFEIENMRRFVLPDENNTSR